MNDKQELLSRLPKIDALMLRDEIASNARMLGHQRVADICLADPKVRRARVLIEKPGALRFARTVGVEIFRERPADE